MFVTKQDTYMFLRILVGCWLFQSGQSFMIPIKSFRVPESSLAGICRWAHAVTNHMVSISSSGNFAPEDVAGI